MVPSVSNVSALCIRSTDASDAYVRTLLEKYQSTNKFRFASDIDFVEASIVEIYPIENSIHECSVDIRIPGDRIIHNIPRVSIDFAICKKILAVRRKIPGVPNFFVYEDIEPIEPNRPSGPFFSDKEGGKDIFDATLWEINNAQSSIRIGMFDLTNTSVSSAILNANRRLRGNVRVLGDLGQATKIKNNMFVTQLITLSKFGVDVRLKDGIDGIFHCKFIVIDNELKRASYAIGSANMTEAAEDRNIENMEFFPYEQRRSAIYAQKFDDYFSQAELLDTKRLVKR